MELLHTGVLISWIAAKHGPCFLLAMCLLSSVVTVRRELYDKFLFLSSLKPACKNCFQYELVALHSQLG